MKGPKNGLRAYTLAVAVLVIVLCVGMVAALLSRAWTGMDEAHREILERVERMEVKCR